MKRSYPDLDLNVKKTKESFLLKNDVNINDLTNDNLNNIVTFFTHKGGVGKTTCLMNMVAKAALVRKKVLVIDCDPQMNSTHFLMGYGENNLNFDRLYNNLVDSHMINIKQVNERTLEEILFLTTYTEKDKNLFDLISKTDPNIGFYESLNNIEEIGYNIPMFDIEIKLITSHPMISEYENDLSAEMNSRIRRSDYKSRFRRFCQFMCLRYSFDMILVDLSPSTSFFNQNILVQSSFIILPCSADEYAHYAIRTIGMWLNIWFERYPDINRNPKLLSVVYNKYKTFRTTLIMNNRKYWTSEAHLQYIRRLIDDGGAITILINDDRMRNLLLDNMNYRDIPLIRDGLSTIAKLQSLNKTCYDAFTPVYHENDRVVVGKMRIEYDILWNKICLGFRWEPVLIPDNTLWERDGDIILEN